MFLLGKIRYIYIVYYKLNNPCTNKHAGNAFTWLFILLLIFSLTFFTFRRLKEYLQTWNINKFTDENLKLGRVFSIGEVELRFHAIYSVGLLFVDSLAGSQRLNIDDDVVRLATCKDITFHFAANLNFLSSLSQNLIFPSPI